MVNFSVITATLGRPTLASAIKSVVPNLSFGDEYIVVFDGPINIEALPQDEECIVDNMLYMNSERSPGKYGNPQRKIAIDAAIGTHIVFVDDDDRLAPGALDRLRPLCEEYRNHVILQPMLSWRNGYPPNELLHEPAHYCLCMGVYPISVMTSPPDWTVDGGDAEWLGKVLAQYPRVSLRSAEPTYLIRPERPDEIVPESRRRS